MAHILIVDDDVMTTEFMSLFFQSEGYEVTVCNSLNEAIASLGDPSRSYSVLVTDLTLPDGSGLELAEVAKKMKLPAIAITGYGKKHLSSEQAALFDDILVKPVDLEVLKAKVSSVFQAHS